MRPASENKKKRPPFNVAPQVTIEARRNAIKRRLKRK